MYKNILLEKIKKEYNSFTNNQKKFSNLLVINTHKFALLNINELASFTKISAPTIVRFSKRLGYPGFTELQREIRETIFSNLTLASKIEKSDFNKKSIEDVFKKSLDNDLCFLQEFILINSIEKLKQAVDLILSAKNRYIYATRCSINIANLFYYFLKQLERGVINLSDSKTYYEEIIEIGSNDLLITFNLPRYSKEVFNLIDCFKKKNGKVILFADSNFIPNYKDIDVLFPIKHESTSFFNNYIVALTLINAILSGVTYKNKAKYFKRLKEIDILIDNSRILTQ